MDNIDIQLTVCSSLGWIDGNVVNITFFEIRRFLSLRIMARASTLYSTLQKKVSKDGGISRGMKNLKGYLVFLGLHGELRANALVREII